MRNKVKQNNKKIILETIIIPLCILYLYYMAFNNHPKTSLVISSIVTIITCIEFIVLYIHEVYVYENQYNFLKVLVTVLCILLIIFTGINLFIKLNIINKIQRIRQLIWLCLKRRFFHKFI